MNVEEILKQPESAERTAALVEWFQSLYEGEPPTLVGGAAVEMYTGGAYTTGDLDFVGSVPSAVERRLLEEGFEKKGRHWIREEGRVFLEFPVSSLEEGERPVEVEVGGHRVRVLSPEALIVDRLAAWQFWRSEQDAVNALLIARAVMVDEEVLDGLAERREVKPALESLREAIERWAVENPDQEALSSWAKQIPGE